MLKAMGGAERRALHAAAHGFPPAPRCAGGPAGPSHGPAARHLPRHLATSPDGRNQEKREKMHDMQAEVKVRVEHGQLDVAGSAALLEGSRWKLVPLDTLAEEMGPEEHAEFLRELEISAKEADAGELIDADDVLAKLRATA